MKYGAFEKSTDERKFFLSFLGKITIVFFTAMITQNAFKQAKRAAREAQAKYVVARRAALALPKTASVIAREEAIGRAIEARYWVQVCRRRLEAGVAQGVLPSGANYSPNAQARLRARGRIA